MPSTPPSEHGTLVVAGQGYVGLPLAVRAVEVGWNVIGVEPDSIRVKRLQAGGSALRRPHHGLALAG